MEQDELGSLISDYVLQSYSNQDGMVLAQKKQKYRSMEQDRKARDELTHLWSPSL